MTEKNKEARDGHPVHAGTQALVDLVRNFDKLPEQFRDSAKYLVSHLVDSIVHSSVPERIIASETLSRAGKRFPKSAAVVNNLLKEADIRRQQISDRRK